MGDKVMTNKALLAIVGVICHLFFGSCSRNPYEQVIGKWQADTGLSILEFFNDGTAKATLVYRIPSGKKLEKKIEGLIIDVGFQLLTYEEATQQGSLFIERSKPKEPVILKFVPENDKKRPWAKIVISTDRDGNVKIRDEYKAQKIGFYKVASIGPLLLTVNLNDKNAKIDSLLFTVNFVDLDLNWVGTLSVTGMYKFTDKNKFEVFVPLNINGSNYNLLICDGSIKDADISLAGKIAGIKDEKYRKFLELATIGDVFDPIDICGVIVADPSQNIYINTGVTKNRLQNVIFRLPGKDIIGSIQDTMLKNEEKHPLLVKSGVDQIGHFTKCYERGVIEAGQTLMVPLGK